MANPEENGKLNTFTKNSSNQVATVKVPWITPYIITPRIKIPDNKAIITPFLVTVYFLK